MKFRYFIFTFLFIFGISFDAFSRPFRHNIVSLQTSIGGNNYNIFYDGKTNLELSKCNDSYNLFDKLGYTSNTEILGPACSQTDNYAGSCWVEPLNFDGGKYKIRICYHKPLGYVDCKDMSAGESNNGFKVISQDFDETNIGYQGGYGDGDEDCPDVSSNINALGYNYIYEATDNTYNSDVDKDFINTYCRDVSESFNPNNCESPTMCPCNEDCKKNNFLPHKNSNTWKNASQLMKSCYVCLQKFRAAHFYCRKVYKCLNKYKFTSEVYNLAKDPDRRKYLKQIYGRGYYLCGYYENTLCGCAKSKLAAGPRHFQRIVNKLDEKDCQTNDQLKNNPQCNLFETGVKVRQFRNEIISNPNASCKQDRLKKAEFGYKMRGTFFSPKLFVVAGTNERLITFDSKIFDEINADFFYNQPICENEECNNNNTYQLPTTKKLIFGNFYPVIFEIGNTYRSFDDKNNCINKPSGDINYIMLRLEYNIATGESSLVAYRVRFINNIPNYLRDGKKTLADGNISQFISTNENLKNAIKNAKNKNIEKASITEFVYSEDPDANFKHKDITIKGDILLFENIGKVKRPPLKYSYDEGSSFINSPLRLEIDRDALGMSNDIKATPLKISLSPVNLSSFSTDEFNSDIALPSVVKKIRISGYNKDVYDLNNGISPKDNASPSESSLLYLRRFSVGYSNPCVYLKDLSEKYLYDNIPSSINDCKNADLSNLDKLECYTSFALYQECQGYMGCLPDKTSIASCQTENRVPNIKIAGNDDSLIEYKKNTDFRSKSFICINSGFEYADRLSKLSNTKLYGNFGDPKYDYSIRWKKNDSGLFSRTPGRPITIMQKNNPPAPNNEEDKPKHLITLNDDYFSGYQNERDEKILGILKKNLMLNDNGMPSEKTAYDYYASDCDANLQICKDKFEVKHRFVHESLSDLCVEANVFNGGQWNLLPRDLGVDYHVYVPLRCQFVRFAGLGAGGAGFSTDGRGKDEDGDAANGSNCIANWNITLWSTAIGVGGGFIPIPIPIPCQFLTQSYWPVPKYDATGSIGFSANGVIDLMKFPIFDSYLSVTIGSRTAHVVKETIKKDGETPRCFIGPSPYKYVVKNESTWTSRGGSHQFWKSTKFGLRDMRKGNTEIAFDNHLLQENNIDYSQQYKIQKENELNKISLYEEELKETIKKIYNARMADYYFSHLNNLSQQLYIIDSTLYLIKEKIAEKLRDKYQVLADEEKRKADLLEAKIKKMDYLIVLLKKRDDINNRRQEEEEKSQQCKQNCLLDTPNENCDEKCKPKDIEDMTDEEKKQMNDLLLELNYNNNCTVNDVENDKRRDQIEYNQLMLNYRKYIRIIEEEDYTNEEIYDSTILYSELGNNFITKLNNFKIKESSSWSSRDSGDYSEYNKENYNEGDENSFLIENIYDVLTENTNQTQLTTAPLIQDISEISLCLDNIDETNSSLYREKLKDLYNDIKNEIDKSINKKKEIINSMEQWVAKESYKIQDIENILHSIEEDYERYNQELNLLNIDTQKDKILLISRDIKYKNLFINNTPNNDSDIFYNLYQQCKSHRSDVVLEQGLTNENYYKKFRAEHKNNYNPLTTAYIGIIDRDIVYYEQSFDKDNNNCNTNKLSEVIKEIYNAKDGVEEKSCYTEESLQKIQEGTNNNNDESDEEYSDDNINSLEECTEGENGCSCTTNINIDRVKPSDLINNEDVDAKIKEGFNNIIDAINKSCEFGALEANEKTLDNSGQTSYVPIITAVRGMSPIDCRVREMGCVSRGGICPCFNNDEQVLGIYKNHCVNKKGMSKSWMYWQCGQSRLNVRSAGVYGIIFGQVRNTYSRELNNNYINGSYLSTYSSNTTDRVGSLVSDDTNKVCNISSAYTKGHGDLNITGFARNGNGASNLVRYESSGGNSINKSNIVAGHWNLYEKNDGAGGSFQHRKGSGAGGSGTMTLSLDTPIEQIYQNGTYYPVLNNDGSKIIAQNGMKDTRCVVKCPIVFVTIKQFDLFFEEIKSTAKVDMLCEYSGDPEDDMEPRSNTYYQPKKCYIITDSVKGVGDVKGRIVTSLDGMCPIAKCIYGTWNDTSENITTGGVLPTSNQKVFDRKIGLCKPNNKYGNETKTSWYFNMMFDKNIYTALSFKGSRKASLESSLLQNINNKYLIKNYPIANCTETSSKAFQSDIYEQLNASSLTLYCNSNGFWERSTRTNNSSIIGNIGNFPTKLYLEDGNDEERRREYNANNENMNFTEYLIKDTRYSFNKRGSGVEFSISNNDEIIKRRDEKNMCMEVVSYQKTIVQEYRNNSRYRNCFSNFFLFNNNNDNCNSIQRCTGYFCNDCNNIFNDCVNKVRNKALSVCPKYKSEQECSSGNIIDYSGYNDDKCMSNYNSNLPTTGNDIIDNYIYDNFEKPEFGRVLFKDLIKCPIIESDKYDYDEDYSGNANWDFAEEGKEVFAKSCNSTSIMSGNLLPSRRCNTNGMWGPVINKCLKGCKEEIKNGIKWLITKEDMNHLQDGQTILTINGACSNKYLNSQNYKSTSGNLTRTCNLLTGKWGDVTSNGACNDGIIEIDDNYKNIYIATPYARVVKYAHGNTYQQIVEDIENGEYKLENKTQIFSPLYLVFLTNQYNSSDFNQYKFYQTNTSSSDSYVTVKYKEIIINSENKSQYAYDPNGLFILNGNENDTGNYIIIIVQNGIAPLSYEYMLAQGDEERNEFLNLENWFNTIFDDSMNFTAQWKWKANLNRSTSSAPFNQTRKETQELFRNTSLVVFLPNYKNNKEKNLKNISLFSPYLAQKYADENNLSFETQDNKDIRFRYPINISLDDYPMVVYNGVNGGYRLYRFEWESGENFDWGEKTTQSVHKIGRNCNGKYFGEIKHNTTKHIMYTYNPAFETQTFASIYCYDGRVFGYHAFQTKILQDSILVDNNTKTLLLSNTKNGDTDATDIYYQKKDEYDSKNGIDNYFFTDRNNQKCGESDFSCNVAKNAYIAGIMSRYFTKHILPEKEVQEVFMKKFNIDKDTHYKNATDKDVKMVLENYAKGSDGYYYRVVEREAEWIIGNNKKDDKIQNIYDIINDKT